LNPNKAVNQILANIPQLEEINLSENQRKILDFLRNQSKPTKAKTVSIKLGIRYDTTRARLSELNSMGFVHQPGFPSSGYSVSKL